MTIDENKIKDFFKGNCNSREVMAISNYLKKHPEILASLFDENEWLQMESDEIADRLPYNEAVLLEKIKYSLEQKALIKKMQSKRWLKYVAAAGLFGICVFSIMRFTVSSNKQKDATIARAPESINSDSIVWANHTLSIESRTLSDGTEVLLDKNSVLRYPKNFNNNKRLLRLNGSAKFIVAKDVHRPFTVVEEQVSTTALGTIFTVKKIANSNLINVHLLRGKVVVKSTVDTTRKVYLLPGDVCTYDGKTLLKASALADDTTYRIEESQVLFNNAKLTTAFNTIEKLYSVKIVYKDVPDSVLSESLYSGSFDRDKVSANSILRSICDVNDLDFEQAGKTSFRIHKNK
jgi:hypothetical protein